MSKKPIQKDPKEEVGTTGHSWDGIEELNNPMPRWWLITFIACIIWGIIWTVLYPAWPLINKATPGILGYSSRGEVAEDIAFYKAQNAEIEALLVSTDLNTIEPGTELANFATQGGEAVFATYCSQCHGAGANGAKGYPNLVDDDWLWGGKMDDIYFTVEHGIRNEADDDTRLSLMPAHGDFLSREEITSVANYVLSLSGKEEEPELVEAGATIFAENCTSCHGENAMGDRAQGAPNLADAIWLHGGDVHTVEETITIGRNAVMPSWNGRLSEAQIRQVTYYVHQLGGGE